MLLSKQDGSSGETGEKTQENHVWLFEEYKYQVWEDEPFRLVQGGDNFETREGNKEKMD